MDPAETPSDVIISYLSVSICQISCITVTEVKCFQSVQCLCVNLLDATCFLLTHREKETSILKEQIDKLNSAISKEEAKSTELEMKAK